jgi:flap endonuclease 1
VLVKRDTHATHQVYAAGSEDMDTLTFGAPILLKNLTASEQKKLPVTEVHLGKALEELDMPMEQVRAVALCGRVCTRFNTHACIPIFPFHAYTHVSLSICVCY